MNKKLLTLILTSVAGCSIYSSNRDSAPDSVPVDISRIPDAVPRYETRTRAGNPGVYEVLGKHYQVLPDSKGYSKKGVASWYGTKFHGKKTSNGEVYDMYAMTAAHKTLPIPSYVKVTNLQNGRSVVVRINDRGPFHDNRIIDLSYVAAVKLGIQQQGTGLVEVSAVEPQQASLVLDSPKRSNKTMMTNPLYIQVGAFSSRINAHQLQQKIASVAQTESRLKVSQAQGNTLYKVQIGPVASAQSADQLYQQLIAMGIDGGTLVSDE
jgi:peptidoglycan lytic transglycosylase